MHPSYGSFRLSLRALIVAGPVVAMVLLPACSEDDNTNGLDGSALSDAGGDTVGSGGGSGGGGGTGGGAADGGIAMDAFGGGDVMASGDTGSQSPDTNVAADPSKCDEYPKSMEMLIDGSGRRYAVFCDWAAIQSQYRCFLTSSCSGISLRFRMQDGMRRVIGSLEPKMGISSTSHGVLTPGSIIVGDTVTGLPDATDITLNLASFAMGSITFRFDGNQVTVKSYQPAR